MTRTTEGLGDWEIGEDERGENEKRETRGGDWTRGRRDESNSRGLATKWRHIGSQGWSEAEPLE